MEALPATSKEQRAFFRQKGWIAFEDAIQSARRAELLPAMKATLATRLPQSLDRSPPFKIYEAGTDIWRESAEVRAAASHYGWSKLVAELVEARTMRLLSDQMWYWRLGGPWKPEQVPFVASGMPWMNLEQIVSYDGILAGVFFNLEGSHEAIIHDRMPLCPFGAPGSVVIVRGDLPLDLRFFQGGSRTTYCVIVGEKQARYRPAPYDPQPLLGKRLGYRPGQQLQDKTHPLLWTS